MPILQNRHAFAGFLNCNPGCKLSAKAWHPNHCFFGCIPSANTWHLRFGALVKRGLALPEITATDVGPSHGGGPAGPETGSRRRVAVGEAGPPLARALN